ncbi:MAG: homoserine O-succinyltransferase [Lachnospiraceae bacterium]|jgi:homoserine O-succinyltransferase|nr:homoserine O-succinyltransferase [Lachnospiraceae bacterium]MCX4304740.1 homoserine O-succinyltransferase [Acetatifactor sp.]
MPIKTQSDLPAKEILENENIFVMDECRAMHQDIRPLQVLILNNMPVKQDTELQLLRALSNTPLQVDVTFMNMQSHVSLNTSSSHLNKFYTSLKEIRHRNFDGMIVTGAPVEEISFEEVDYWQETCEIFDWAESHVTSTLHICWAAQAGFYHYYGINKQMLPEKLSGVYEHRVSNRKVPLVRGFDDVFLAPHSRHTETPAAAVHACPELTVLAESPQAGVYLAIAEGGKKIFVTGHPEYDRYTLNSEYHRDLDKGLSVPVPCHYYPDDDPDQRPLLQWRSHSNNLYSNWLNYYVYQVTPYNL